jgi:hypothetical protein
MKRDKLQNQQARALLILDGHPTRDQFQLWKELNEDNIDVLVIPAHTSNILQPLDRVVNGNFKISLQQMRSFKKKEISKNLNQFLREVSTCIYTALNPAAVRKGFHLARACNENNDLLELENEINKYVIEFPEKCPDDLPVFYKNLFI